MINSPCPLPHFQLQCMFSLFLYLLFLNNPLHISTLFSQAGCVGGGGGGGVKKIK